MDFPPAGDADQHKLLYAKRILAGLAYISLTSNDRLTLTALVNGLGAATFGPTRGRARGIAALRFISKISPPPASPTWTRPWLIMRCGRAARLDAGPQRYVLPLRWALS